MGLNHNASFWASSFSKNGSSKIWISSVAIVLFASKNACQSGCFVGEAGLHSPTQIHLWTALLWISLKC